VTAERVLGSDREPPDIDRYIRDELPRVIRMVTESRVQQLELENGDFSLLIQRASPSANGEAMHVPPAIAEDVETGGVTSNPSNLRLITAPMVGTFYHSERPGGAPLIVEGSRIEPGALIGVIEALGVMTEVESDSAGVVEMIVSEDGQPVEYGQPLVEVRRDG
jgi:acetyl-CoA carboxylase biotin carboxyl carrier protein